MDDVAFFDHVLTDDELATAFNSGAIALIPEPSSIGLLLLGGTMMMRRSRSKG
jgi:hypothetical protein